MGRKRGSAEGVSIDGDGLCTQSGEGDQGTGAVDTDQHRYLMLLERGRQSHFSPSTTQEHAKWRTRGTSHKTQAKASGWFEMLTSLHVTRTKYGSSSTDLVWREDERSTKNDNLCQF
jgi:hypothetical protein